MGRRAFMGPSRHEVQRLTALAPVLLLLIGCSALSTRPIGPGALVGAATPTPAAALPVAEATRISDDVKASVAEAPDHFGGAWIAEDGVLTIAWVSGHEAARDALLETIPDGFSIASLEVTHSMSELLFVRDELRAFASGRPDRISSVSTMAPANAVLVSFTAPDPALQSELRARYGGIIIFDVEPYAPDL